MTLPLDTYIRAVQRKVGALVDGKPETETWSKICAALGITFEDQPVTVPIAGESSERSARNIETLHPMVRPKARAFIAQAAKVGVHIEILSGTRSYAEQNELYRKGRRGVPGENTVTNAPAGHSSHNFGNAFDIGIFQGRDYLEDSPLYKRISEIGKSLGLDWGGDWIRPVDEPHYYLRPDWAKGMSEGQMMTGLRERHDAGKDIFT